MENLEQMFDDLSWDEIINIIDMVILLDVQDELVTKVINFVREKNKISFKQWKVLYNHINYVNRKKKRFKYGY
jgi:hypothetical protein